MDFLHVWTKVIPCYIYKSFGGSFVSIRIESLDYAFKASMIDNSLAKKIPFGFVPTIERSKSSHSARVIGSKWWNFVHSFVFHIWLDVRNRFHCRSRGDWSILTMKLQLQWLNILHLRWIRYNLHLILGVVGLLLLWSWRMIIGTHLLMRSSSFSISHSRG